MELLRDMEDLGLKIVLKGEPTRLATLTVRPMHLNRFKEGPGSDQQLQMLREGMKVGKQQDFAVFSDGFLRGKDRLFIPEVEDLRREILTEADSTPYIVHAGSTNVYKDLVAHYW